MTHYETLGVAENASADEIKRAYRKLASQHHPDKGGDVKKFQEIEEAYRVLSDTQQRQQYDMQRNGVGQFRFTSSGPGFTNIDDVFRSFGFGGDPFGNFRQQQPRRNKDLRIAIPVPLVATLTEHKKTISVQTTNGERTTVEVTIPRGVTNGTTIKYTGLGDNLFNTIPRGDLYVQFNIHGHEDFLLNGIDLYTPVSVNCLLAIVGGKAMVEGLDNKQFELTIPPGTQPGTRFRIPNQGMYQMNSDTRGHLYAEIIITIPKDLPNEQLEIIRSLTNT
jgi:DnaJ-class molecular chaperone